MEVAAVRETFEETGFPCDLYPVMLETRIPAQGQALGPYVIREVKNCVEPFYVTVRQLKDRSLKMIWWYITWVLNNNAEKVEGVCMPSEEGYVSRFVDVEEAIAIMKGTPFNQILVNAVDLVQKQLDSSSLKAH